MQKYKAKNAVELLGREEEVVAASDALAEIEKRDKEIDFCQQQIANFNPCGHTEFESISCGVCGYPDSVKYIAVLKEKLVSNRGCIGYTIGLEKEIAELKDELNTERLFHKSFVETTQAADKDYEESILKLKILYVLLKKQLEKQVIIDICVCPNCGATLDVEQYGKGKCSECGCPVTVFPDHAIQVDIAGDIVPGITFTGAFWITLPEDGRR